MFCAVHPAVFLRFAGFLAGIGIRLIARKFGFLDPGHIRGG
jgi:hypothetical protein